MKKSANEGERIEGSGKSGEASVVSVKRQSDDCRAGKDNAKKEFCY